MWGVVAAVDDTHVVVHAGQRALTLRHGDVAVYGGPGEPAAIAEAARVRAGALDAALLHRAALTGGERRLTVAEILAAAGLPVRREAAAAWLCLWDHPELFAREGRIHFRPRPPAEVAEAAARLARRRHEESMLAELAADEPRLAAGEWTLETWAQARPAVEAVLAHVACGQDLPAELPEAVRLRIEARLDADHEAGGSRWPRERTAALALGLRDPWRDGLPRLARHQRWLAAQPDAAPLDATPALAPTTALWAIDEATTEDRDDAVGLREDGPGHVWVDIAVADVTCGFGGRREWDLALAAVGTTTYLPTAMVPMVPTAWGADAHSLDAGQLRPVFLIQARLDRQTGRLSGTPTIRRGTVTLAGMAAYADVDAGRGPEFWPLLAELAGRMEAERVERGADRIEQPEARVRVQGGLPVDLVRQTPWIGGRAVIREMMILANAVIADHLARVSLPAPYRVQAAAGGERGITQVRLRPGPHAGIGVQQYLQATSPIRRFGDVLAQRQLAASLGFGDAMDVTSLGPLVETAEQSAGLLRRWMSDADRYWKLRWLEAQPSVDLTAHVERVVGDGVRIRLEPVELRLWAPPPPRGVAVGRVEIRALDAETGRLDVEWVG
jgi:exoribonuclease-2